jgi:hypothetical protein
MQRPMPRAKTMPAPLRQYPSYSTGTVKHGPRQNGPRAIPMAPCRPTDARRTRALTNAVDLTQSESAMDLRVATLSGRRSSGERLTDRFSEIARLELRHVAGCAGVLDVRLVRGPG